MSGRGAKASEANAQSAEKSGAKRGRTSEKPAPLSGVSNQALQATFHERSSPLSPKLRRRAERQLGVDLGSVRLLQEHSHSGITNDLNARAVSNRDLVVLGPSAAPTSLAHELVHVAQTRRFGRTPDEHVSRPDHPAEAEARKLAPLLFHTGQPLPVRERPAARWHRDDNAPVVIVPIGMSSAPLAAYSGLQDRLSADDWNALNAAARRRTQQVTTGTPPPEENELVRTEISVSLGTILHPRAPESTESGGDLWLTDIFALRLAGGGVNHAAMAMRLQKEILSRWLDQNGGILNEAVTIALVDPEARGGATASLLSFTLRERPVTPTNGVLTLAAVDESIRGGLGSVLEGIQADLSTLTGAMDKAQKGEAMLSAGRDLVGRSHSKIVPGTIDEIAAAMRSQITALDGVSGNPFADLVSPTKTAMNSFVNGDLETFRAEHTEWRTARPYEPNMYGRQLELGREYEKRLKQGDFWDRVLAGIASKRYNEGMAWSNLGGAARQEHELGLAYQQGLISYESWQEGVEAASRRGAIFAGVTVALTIATMGLGLYIGPSLSLAGSVAYGFGSGLALGTVPMMASNWYAGGVEFSDPAMQQWWDSTLYTPEQIMLSGAIGAGIGAAFPIAGALLNGLKGQGAQAVTALSRGQPLPEGVVARTIGRGAVEFSIPAEGVTIRVTTQGYQVIGPAGRSATAVLEEGLWPAGMVGEGGFAPGTAITVAHPRFPTAIGLGTRGWGMVSPHSAQPVQLGLWPELSLPAGPAGRTTIVSTAVPTGTAGEAGPGLVFSGGTLPGFVPPAPPRFLPPSASPLNVLGPGPQPHALGPAQPFGLLATSPVIEYAGPLIPPGVLSSEAKASFQARTGGRSLFYGEGAVMIRLGSGIFLPGWHRHAPSAGGILTSYGTSAFPNMLMDIPGQARLAIVQSPITGAGLSGRPGSFPMTPQAMFDPVTGLQLARSHTIPVRDRLPAAPGAMSSALDPGAFVAHPQKYNTRFRRTIEGRLRRRGSYWVSFNDIGDQPRVTQGGFIIPEAEYIVEFAPGGGIANVWQFPFDNLSRYDNLTGNIDEILDSFLIDPSRLPSSPIHRP